MTKKMIWRLKEQPTTESLRELVKDGILTKQEAREILFTLTDSKEDEKEIQFLREMIDRLTDHRPTKIVEVIRETSPIYIQQPWYKSYDVWCSTVSSNTANGSMGDATLPYGTNFASLSSGTTIH